MSTTDRLVRSLKPNALVRVIVPSMDRSRRPLPHSQFTHLVEETLLEAATGTTTVQGRGTWRNGSTKSVRERVAVVEAQLLAELSLPVRRRLARRLTELASIARQDALLVFAGEEGILIPGEEVRALKKEVQPTNGSGTQELSRTAHATSRSSGRR